MQTTAVITGGMIRFVITIIMPTKIGVMLSSTLSIKTPIINIATHNTNKIAPKDIVNQIPISRLCQSMS